MFLSLLPRFAPCKVPQCRQGAFELKWTHDEEFPRERQWVDVPNSDPPSKSVRGSRVAHLRRVESLGLQQVTPRPRPTFLSSLRRTTVAVGVSGQSTVRRGVGRLNGGSRCETKDSTLCFGRGHFLSTKIVSFVLRDTSTFRYERVPSYPPPPLGASFVKSCLEFVHLPYRHPSVESLEVPSSSLDVEVIVKGEGL